MKHGPGTTVTGHKLQASSLKIYTQQILKASSTKRLKKIPRFKRQAASLKLQAASDKLHNFFAFIKFQATRSEVLC